LLPPAKDSVGARLLKKMGWRLGHGIGPRITYKQLRLQEGGPVEKDEVVDEEADKHLYAPRDTKAITFHKKENAFGLGYVPGQGLTDIVQGRNGQGIEAGPNLSGEPFRDNDY
jgi:G patch domain-containing protein 1